MMFLFQNISGADWLMWIAVIAALMLLNEAARANKWVALALFLVVPGCSDFVDDLCLAHNRRCWKQYGYLVPLGKSLFCISRMFRFHGFKIHQEVEY